MVKILIVDDHEMVRIGLATILKREPSFQIVGEAGSADECLAMVGKFHPDVVVMDIRMPERSGIGACREITANFPDTHVLMLTSFADEDAVMDSIIAGAKGYVLKQIGSKALTEAIQKVVNGESLIDPTMIQKVMERIRQSQKSPLETLTEKEKVILHLIAEGKTNKEIAEIVFLSEKTVRNYVSNILQKLNLSHRSQAAVYVVKKGLQRNNL